jgi:hypothetical protein
MEERALRGALRALLRASSQQASRHPSRLDDLVVERLRMTRSK